jgi:hypothetical protein
LKTLILQLMDVLWEWIVSLSPAANCPIASLIRVRSWRCKNESWSMEPENAGPDSACRGGPCFLGLSPEWPSDRAGTAGPRRHRQYSGGRGVGVRKGTCHRLGARVEGVRHGYRRLVECFLMVQHPPRQCCFGGLLDPLVDQGRNFAAEIGRMIEPGHLEALQG